MHVPTTAPTRRSTRTPGALLTLLLIAAALTGCVRGFDPQQPGEIFDALEGAGVLRCTERTVVDERTEACASADGELFAVITDDPTRVIRESRVGFGGPWIADPRWVIVSADGDLDRLRQLRDALGEGALYQDIDEVPVEVR